MSHQIYAVEGLDRLGKSTLIEGIQQQKGYFEVIHFGKPKLLDAYEGARHHEVPFKSAPAYEYQRASFRNSMLLARSKARLIFDRWHLGEAVYAPLYRSYDGGYVFEFERLHGLDEAHHIRLILLTEDFQIARHFVDDGESLGAIQNREKEQEMFISAFERSIIPDKKIISVTDQGLGGFKPKGWILQEATWP